MHTTTVALGRRCRALVARLLVLLVSSLAISSCGSSDPEGLASAQHASTTVKMDFFHRPLPEIPLPNDIATVYDATSATGRRINASMVAPTGFERHTRELLDRLDGFGVFEWIAIPFTGPLDVESIRAGHREANYDTSNDVVYLIDIDRSSPDFGHIQPLDVGNGNYPVALEDRSRFWDNDARAGGISSILEEVDEDTNSNDRLDQGEDTDGDGVFDKPNYFPQQHPAPDDLAGRADALTTFYERETNTLLVHALQPLRERTRYAVVVTRRIRDINGEPVGSPYPTINHTAQTEDLQPLLDVLPNGLSLSDVAFAFSFTTQSVESHWRAVRDGLYGIGVQAHLGQQFPARVDELLPLRDPQVITTATRPQLLYGEDWARAVQILGPALLNLDPKSKQYSQLIDGIKYIDYFVMGSFKSPQLFPRTDGPRPPAGTSIVQACKPDCTCPCGQIDVGTAAEHHCENQATQGQYACTPDCKCPCGQINVVTEAGDRCETWLPLNDQSWPPDLDRVPAPAQSETIYFTLAVPRKETSVRGQGKPAPVAVLGHGYGSQRFEIMQFAGYFAKHGLATIAIDGPSHGIGIPPDQQALARTLLGTIGLAPFVDATFLDRAFDQDGDGVKDSGADFWTSYLFHTRDIVRQFMLDYSQLVRIIHTFNGTNKWDFDVSGDGVPDLAGDFDGDGVLDIGGGAPITMTGGSLGGIMSMVMGGAEPLITAIGPISGGAGYGDIGLRSVQGGVVEAFILRVMGPLYVGTLDPGSGVMHLQTIVPQINHLGQYPIGDVSGVHPGDTLVAENLVNGSRGCGLVDPSGRVRASLESDRGNRIRLRFYHGPQQLPGEGCIVRSDATMVAELDTFGAAVTHLATTYAAGAPLVAIEDGLGLPRATPQLRRMTGIGQAILDPGDPVAYARHVLLEPLQFATGERTGAHVLELTSQGDMNVPAASGVTFGRAAGVIDYLHDDPRYGKPDNQVLIDTYTAEAVDSLKRHVDASGSGVHLDVEAFSAGSLDIWGPDYPRLSPPLRIGLGERDPLGGVSASFFTLTNAHGQHGFDAPGGMTDEFRKQCQQACTATGGTDPCGCKQEVPYDVGTFLASVLGDYLASDGTELDVDLCHSRGDCPTQLPAPPSRSVATLP